MNYSVPFLALLFSASSLFAQTTKPATFKAISEPVNVPLSLYLYDDSTEMISFEDIDYSVFNTASIPGEKAFALADKNKDKAVSCKELTDALNRNLFYLSLDVTYKLYYFFFLDDNHDGYINNDPRIRLTDDALTIIESIDHKKYSYDCDAMGYDKNRKVQPTGRCAKDNKVSISELVNACKEKKLWVGNRLYWKQ